jgi:DNA repair exonuclease SbcCD ATPase subunit
MIKSIALANFRRHEFLELEFDSGFNSIVGNENAGKSTVLHAIIYCLFGAQALGIPADRLWRRERGKDDDCDVQVTLDTGHLIYRSDTKAVVILDGQRIASGANPVTKWVEDRFGMSKSDLLLMMHSPPNETRALLEAGPTGLQAKVERLAGVDVIDLVLSKLKPDLDRALGALAATGEVGELQINSLRFGVVSAEADEAGLKAKALAAQERHAEASGLRAAAEQAWSEAHETDKQLEQLRHALATTTEKHLVACTELADTRKALSKLPEPDPDRTALLEFALGEAEEALAGAVKAKTERDFVQGEFDSAEKWSCEHAVKMKSNALAIQEWKAAEARMFEASRSLDRLMLERNAACTKFKEADAFLNTGVCPKCDRPFENFDRDKAEKAREKALAEKTLAQDAFEEGRAEYRLVEAEEERLKASVDFGLSDKWERNEAKLMELAGELATMPKVTEEELADRTGKHDRLKKKLDQARQEEKEWDRLTSEFGRLTTTVGEIEGESRRLSQELGDLNGKAVSVEKAAAAMSDARLAEETALRDWSNTGSALKDARARLDTLQKELESLTAQREKWLAAKAEVDVLTALQKYLRSSRARLSKDIWEGLLAYASYLVSSASSGKLNRITRNEKGEFMVDGTPALDQGEAMKAVIGLALRVAMARTFQGSGLPLLLDEVSANARDGVAAMTAGMLAGLGNQVIAVTHRSGDAVLGKIIEVG